MPFTPSHAALALPFLRTPLVPSAVVIGTMGPDLPYFVPFDSLRADTHSAVGIFTIDLGIALAAWIVWIVALRSPIVDLAPRWVSERMPSAPTPPWRAGRRWLASLVLLVVAIIVGTITHLLWDAPSHPGWITDHVPVLRVQLAGKYLYSLLQYASSIVGLVVLAMWVRHWVAHTPKRIVVGFAADRARTVAWLAVSIAVVSSSIVTWCLGITAGSSLFEPSLIFRVARVGIGFGIATGAVACVCWWAYRLRSTATTLPSTSA